MFTLIILTLKMKLGRLDFVPLSFGNSEVDSHQQTENIKIKAYSKRRH